MKIPSEASLTTVLLVTMAISSRGQHSEARQRKRQVTSQGVLLDTPQDRQSEASLLQVAGAPVPAAAAPAPVAAASPLADVQAHAKFFQYAHVPKKDHYEIGHRKGSEHHFTERHEKAHPGSGEFKTKVRWGDKHGGYGEHYWDYNHAGHGGDNHDEPSDNVHEYQEYDGDNNRNKRDSRYHTPADAHNGPDHTSTDHKNHGSADRHHQASAGLRKDVPKKQSELYLDETTGRIVDKSTGQNYMLHPV